MMPEPERRKRKKQPTRAKIRGCYNCSQRRVSCDRGTPQCRKCVNSGLQCSGLGPRYRFAGGIASRGRFKGKSEPVSIDTSRHELTSSDVEDSAETRSSEAQRVRGPGDHPEDLQVVVYGAHEQPFQSYIHYSLDHVNGRDRYLLNYYVEKVAPVMVVIDKPFNGWRDLLLPMSEHCPMIFNAALAAAEHHVAVVHQHHSSRESAARHYTAAIRGLMQHSTLQPLDHEMTATHIATILLLLTSDLIASGSDFQILFTILKRLVEMSGNSAVALRRGDTGSFLTQQVQKLCFYGEPFLREATDTELVATGFAGAIESFHAQLQRNPEHSAVIVRLVGLVEQARDIYVHRARNDLPPDAMRSMVDRFLVTAGDIPVSSPGGHSLVWAYFIVAAESSDPRHRRFFVRKLRELWIGTGFANTLTAVVELRRIWTIGSGQRWTYVLPSMAQTFIM